MTPVSVIKRYVRIFGPGYTLSNLFARSRLLLLRALARLLAFPIFARSFSQMCTNLSDTLTRTDFREAHMAAHGRISGPAIAFYPFGEKFDPGFRREKAFDAKAWYLLKKVRGSVDNGLVWTPANIFLAESIGGPNQLFSGPLEAMLFPVQPLGTQGPVILCPDTGYYHFIFEILPNVLHLIDRFKSADILISRGARPYVAQALALALGQDAVKARVKKTQGVFQIRRLLLVPVFPRSGFCHPADLERLRILGQTIFPDPVTPWRKIYVSRAMALSRAVENEAEILARLRPLGFEPVFPETLGLRDQIQLFRESQEVVAPHGAGLSNLIWMTGNCRVVELMPRPMNDVYARLAVASGFDYQAVFPTDAAHPFRFDPDTVAALAQGKP